MQKNADATILDNNGRAAVHMAILNGNIKLTKLLLSSNKDLLELRDRLGQTPLYLATEQDYANLCNLLITFGANIFADKLTDNNSGCCSFYLGLRLKQKFWSDLLFSSAEIGQCLSKFIKKANDRNDDIFLDALTHMKNNFDENL